MSYNQATGKKTEKLIDGYCEKCYNKEFNLIEVPKEITFTKL
jgi:NMD protein affecting ribosome stability and mRNA decay